MIIFDLETLADDSHRRHFIKEIPCNFCGTPDEEYPNKKCSKTPICSNYEFIPDWKSYNDACGEDNPIESVISIWNNYISLGCMDLNEIWTGRCESMREETKKWLRENLICFNPYKLRMRPIGVTTPYHMLKEMWFNERCSDLIEAQINGVNPVNHNIDFVFEKDLDSIEMWRRRGVFVFNCNQRK